MLIFTPSMKPKSGEAFSAWFARQNFRNFSSSEIESYWSRTKRGAKNSEPPRYLWHRFVPTLRVVDDLRDHFGKPVTVTSNYRDPAYNTQCGSSNPPNPRALAGRGSQHVRFAAADIQVKGVSPSRVASYLLAQRRAGAFVGGIGKYSTFVHIDTRPYNASWGF